MCISWEVIIFRILWFCYLYLKYFFDIIIEGNFILGKYTRFGIRFSFLFFYYVIILCFLKSFMYFKER